METFIALNGGVLLTTDEQLLEISLGVAAHSISKDALLHLVDRRVVRLAWSSARIQRWLKSRSLPDEADIFEALERDADIHSRVYAVLQERDDTH